MSASASSGAYDIRRRTLLGGAVAAATGLALAGCGDGGEGGGGGGRGGGGGGDGRKGREGGGTVRLSFWSWVPGIDRPVALWNRAHPAVQVDVEKVSAVGGAQYAKMHAAIEAENPPDLGQIEFPVLPSFLIDNGLLDLTTVGGARYADRFVDWQWRQVVYGKGVYAIPQASGPMGLFLRRDLFDKWGVEVPRTWDEYETAAKAVRRNGAWIDTFAPTNGNRFAGFAWQAGAKWFRTAGDTWVVHIDDGPTRRVADYWEALVKGKYVKTIPDRQNAWYKDIQTGAVAAWIGGSWGDALLVGNAPGTKGKWRAEPLPQWKKGADVQVNWGGSTTAIFAGCPHPREALDFAVWLNTDPGAIKLLIEGGYGFPSAKKGYALADLDVHRDFFGGQRYSEVFAAAGNHVDTDWKWGPMMDTLYQRLGDALTEALGSGTSFVSALEAVQRQTLADLRGKGLKVEGG